MKKLKVLIGSLLFLAMSAGVTLAQTPPIDIEPVIHFGNGDLTPGACFARHLAYIAASNANSDYIQTYSALVPRKPSQTVNGVEQFWNSAVTTIRKSDGAIIYDQAATARAYGYDDSGSTICTLGYFCPTLAGKTLYPTLTNKVYSSSGALQHYKVECQYPGDSLCPTLRTRSLQDATLVHATSLLPLPLDLKSAIQFCLQRQKNIGTKWI